LYSGFPTSILSQITMEDIRKARRVAVGSKNPVKLAAARAVVTRLVSNMTVEAIDVASGVPDQPFGDEQTIEGALARARAAREKLDADFGIGLEGGVVEMPDGSMRTCAWAGVVSRSGRHGVGGSLAMPLPDSVARLIRGGIELGHAMDQLTGHSNTKHGAGAVGILTAGLVDRQAAYEVLVAYACAPFLPTSELPASSQ
jgi:inosine/xanthosine triphosphatase